MGDGGRRAELFARLCLTIGALAPYWPLLTFRTIYVTDDFFASDIFNGELPGRVLIGQILREGGLAAWTSQLCSGLSLAGTPADPAGLAAFGLLPPAAALDLYVVFLLLIAAHGTYALARRFGADRTGSVLAGIAFAGSGYIACQLKHLAIISTVVWLPLGLLLIDRAVLRRDDQAGVSARRSGSMAAFGLVYAVQVLSAFPQSAYICALVYGSFALYRVLSSRQPGSWRTIVWPLGGLTLAITLGAAGGALVLVPLGELGSISDRAEPLGWYWSTRVAYWPPNILTFLVPYIHGDISNNTYSGQSLLFWEDYGYVGVATFLLAIYGGVRERHRSVIAYTVGMTVVAYLLVIGVRTPVYRVFYDLLPGMSLFRLPTRFLFVVDLGLCVLGGIGLTRLAADLSRFRGTGPLVPQWIGVALCAFTAVDLFIHQPRQNPMVPASTWLEPPQSVVAIRNNHPHPRTLTPHYRQLHRDAFARARGWADMDPYFELRDVLQPNIGGGLWKIPSADCYAGIAPRWYVEVWGDHNRPGSVMSTLTNLDLDAKTLTVNPELPRVLAAYGVTHLVSAYPQQGSSLELLGHFGSAYIYRVPNPARVRVVPRARAVNTDAEASARLLDPGFNPGEEILVHDAPITPAPQSSEVVPVAGVPGHVVITHEDSRELIIDAETVADGFLLLADTYYPGWSADIDGAPTPIFRANLSVRGIQLPSGRHRVRFVYESVAVRRGFWISVAALSTLMIWGAAAYVRARHSPNDPQNPTTTNVIA